MKLIFGERRKANLSNLSNIALAECDDVKAAVAYVTDLKTLIEPCYKQGKPLVLYARYDKSIPVHLDVLEWFLGKSSLCVCKLVPDIFHPKIIWWRPYGVYIGSANLTASAWFRNFEAGVFIPEDELEEYALKQDLDLFFDALEAAASPLTKELVRDICEYQKIVQQYEKDIEDKFEKFRSLPKLSSVSDVTIRKDFDKKRKELFLDEWYRALQYIRDIGENISGNENRPSWLPQDTPKGMQADQFLHAYYYNKVMESNRARHHEFHEENHAKINLALEDAIRWWKSLASPPSNELDNINTAKILRTFFSRSEILSINEDQFVSCMFSVHAFRDYARRASYQTLGLDAPLPSMNEKERVDYLARRVFRFKNSEGNSVLDVINFMLYGGPVEKVPDRMFDLNNSPHKKIRHVGLSTLGELTGWTLANEFPSRNGRTSKALFALGYDVTIHTE